MSSTRGSPLSDFANWPCAGGTLDKLIQPAILTILAREDLHGYRIAQRIADMPPFKGHKPDVSGVYRFLRSMEDRALVVGSWDLSKRGPAKRLYKLTAAGQQCLSRWIESLTSYRRAIGSLLAMAKRASAGTSRPRRSSRAKSRVGKG